MKRPVVSAQFTPLLRTVALALLLAGPARGGDILRGGTNLGARPDAGRANSAATSDQAARATANAQDSLARTTRAMQDVQAMQAAARALATQAASAGADPNQPGIMLPTVPEGLAPGGLVAAPGVTWRGATSPVQSNEAGRTLVTVEQQKQTAVLTWESFNIGRQTTLRFDQSAGGADRGKWIAFNKVQDPTGRPSQILGSIEADGQVYVINGNGIIFGGASQVNVRTLVASSLPINDNLIERGLLNNPDAQFLLSGLFLPGGSDGTPAFTPAAPLTPSGRYGDVVVQAGAVLQSPVTADGNGGRIMLAGPNVINDGTIRTEAGQTILAAGLQVGVTAHATNDPSLRGLDVFVGAVDEKSGTATNSGVIEVLTGSAWMAGRRVNQLGVIESSTSVNLNGRIDLRASYGAVSNPTFDESGSGGPPFVYQHTGLVTLGPGSVTRILPDYEGTQTVPGTQLPQRSQINAEGLAIHLGPGASVLAPNSDVMLRAGVWPYQDVDGDGTTLVAGGSREPGLASVFSGTTQRFLFSGGQIYLDRSSLLSVAGSTGVFVPLSQSILGVEFRGSELADSPLQRMGPLRATALTVDLRRTGVNGGRFWIGTPLGDVTGLAGLIQRNAAQLTAAGGNVTLQAGDSIVIQQGATVDVSGGFFQHEGGMVQTTRLLQGGRLVEIADATPDQVYDGVYTGTFSTSHARYGITRTFATPWMSGRRFESGYVQGADGGALTLTAPSMAIDGELRGLTTTGPRQRSSVPAESRLSLVFESEEIFQIAGATLLNFLTISPTPPAVIFAREAPRLEAKPFQLLAGTPDGLDADRIAEVTLWAGLLDEDGFGHLAVRNTDGDISVPQGVGLSAPARGSISLTGANVALRGDVTAPGGVLAFQALNISPQFIAEFPLVNRLGASAPPPNIGRGLVTLGAGVRLSAAGLIVDDRAGNREQLLAADGGSISIEAFSADLQIGSVINVDGGVSVSERGAVSYGAGGSIAIRTGKDPGLESVLGGTVALHATLSGHSGAKGGSLTLQAETIQIGGESSPLTALLLAPDFFRQGGFASYALVGIGAPSGEVDEYVPGVRIASDTRIEPVAESLLAVPISPGTDGVLLRRIVKADGLRSQTSLSFSALGADDPFTTGTIEVRGDVVMERGAQIVADAGASISFKGQTVALLGSVEAPGGTISITGAGSFPLGTDAAPNATSARPTVYIGPEARLSVAGAAVFVPDVFGRRRGNLFTGGTIAVSGNIVADAGALLDVSGASTVFDLHPSTLGASPTPLIPLNSGVTAPLAALQTVATRVDSDGGLIDLQGSQMLFTDATLLGAPGGPAAVGGTLSIFSGRFYPFGASRTGADINLVVTQSGSTIAATNTRRGVGLEVLDESGTVLSGMGYFAADRFQAGGFDSLDLGFKYLNVAPVPYGGNIDFQGPVSLSVPGRLRVAGGGVIRADAAVTLRANHAVLGQAFLPPAHPSDQNFPFQRDPATPSRDFPLAPEFGPGSLAVRAELIDVGNLALLGIERAELIADGGDIRGAGTLSASGDVYLRAAQIYPTTLANFEIFAYDHAAGGGSVVIDGSGTRSTPLSAGGNLSIFASSIVQNGVLRAPLGSITLGWDGATDFDLSDADIDPPFDPVARRSAPVPIAKSVTLRSGSATSVAAVDAASTVGLLVPFGLSPDGSTWIDPRGVNVTVGGLPEKRIAIAGDTVVAEAGSTLDLRGGGDLYAYRWVPGPGGSVDILGTASTEWSAGVAYDAGDLVTSGGLTWSARVAHSGKAPAASAFWTLLPESYAIVPGFSSAVAPYAPFNTGPNALALGGDPGYASPALRTGDQIHLAASQGLPAGTYTLLPRRYALLPGARLVTLKKGDPMGRIDLPVGSSLVPGYRLNAFSRTSGTPAARVQFEVAPPSVVRERAEYADYFANVFFSQAAEKLDVARPQRLPIDGGYAALHGNTGLTLAGQIASARPANGRGTRVDLSSFADIHVVGGMGVVPANAGVALDAAVLGSWGVESLFIGGIRRDTAAGAVPDVRTSRVVLDNPGSTFSGPEITLASRAEISLTPGSALESTGALSEAARTLLISGDGTLVRVSGDPLATISRTGLAGATTPLLTVGAGARLAGAAVILDSTYGTRIDPTTQIFADTLELGSGQISIAPGGLPGQLAGSVVEPHLVLAGDLLRSAGQVKDLTLRSYRTVDVYGAGEIGSMELASLRISAAGVRGFDQGAGTVVFRAGRISLDNAVGAALLPAPGTVSGALQLDAGTVRLGEGAFTVAGYRSLRIDAAGGLIGMQTGSLTTEGDLIVTAPLLTGERGSTQSITAAGAIVLAGTGGSAQVVGGLGASLSLTGQSITAGTAVRLPSGQLTLRATTGSVAVTGALDVSGTAQIFYDLTRYSDGGSISLIADQGDVAFLEGSLVSVAAAEGGGNAGFVTIRAGNGVFDLSGGQFLGSARTDGRAGTFTLDAGALPAFTQLTDALGSGGFSEKIDLRVRSGDILIGNRIAARNFLLSADLGDIRVTGTIDASGRTGGRIALVAGGSLVLEPGSLLTARGVEFRSAGKGGDIRLEAGAAVNGASNLAAMLDIRSGATIDLGVDALVPGDYTAPGSSAFQGQFTGKLHLRAPRIGNDVAVGSIAGSIAGASSVLVEGYRVYLRDSAPGGVSTLDPALRTAIDADAAAYIAAGYDTMLARLLAGNPDAVGLDSVLVIAPGVEIVNRTGSLQLGTPNNANGTATSLNTADWDLSSFRYGPRQAPGVLTLRAAGNLVFNNALSDGFNPVAATAANGHSSLWLATLQDLNPALPVNTQSWSYRLAAGTDVAASDFHAVVPGAGSVLVGEFYLPVPNTSSSGPTAATGLNGLTANSIRISISAANTGTRYEVVRTGAGDIDIAAGHDVQLRNQFATIYTAGVRISDPTTVYAPNDFVVPAVDLTGGIQPPNVNGAVQQQYPPQWALAGGDVSISAGSNIWRTTLRQGQVIADSSGQLPVNWLYRRGFVDPATGLFGVGGVDAGDPPVEDASASTTWWIDYSNFFEGFGALGGGDIALLAGGSIINADALIPTNARMPGQNAAGNLAPNATRLLEYGGGDLVVRAGRNIDGGIYYVERGQGTLFAGGVITTNESRSPSRGILSSTPQITDPLFWLPTTLFAGKSQFDVSARGDILLGPVSNPFLLPSGLNNRYWYKTYFSTYSPDASVDVASFGGSVTHRLGDATTPTLNNWLSLKNLFTAQNTSNSSNFQPWIRLAETRVGAFNTFTGIMAPTLRSTAFAGDINIAGALTLAPSPSGTLELAASGGLIGLQPTGRLGTTTRWTSAIINVSDADPASVPGIASPFAYQSLFGREARLLRDTTTTFLNDQNLVFAETGTVRGRVATVQIQQALHAGGLLHRDDPDPVRLYATGGDITGLTLFSPKATRITAENDITDIAFYLQNVNAADISVVSAGRDITPYNENTALRSLACNSSLGNVIVDPSRTTVTGASTKALQGDVQIGGPGVLEVLAGRNLDLGAGANFTDGTGVGITSIGRARNPFLPLDGADLIVFAGVSGPAGSGPALSLRASSLTFEDMSAPFTMEGDATESAYLARLGGALTGELTDEQKAIVALEEFYRLLRQTGRDAAATGDYSTGTAAIDSLFGAAASGGEIFTQAREIRTTSGGSISVAVPGGGLTMASDIFGNPLTPPGIVTEFGGAVSIFTDGSVDIGSARIFTLRGGDIIIWSSTGDVAAGNAPKTVVTAPPTRVVIDATSAAVQTDLGGLATGGGIGVLAAVQDVEPGDVDLIAPQGVVDAGDAGIRVTGNLNIAAVSVLNASNIQVGGTSAGVPAAPVVAVPNLGAISAANSATGAQSANASDFAERNQPDRPVEGGAPSIIVVEVLGYGGGG